MTQSGATAGRARSALRRRWQRVRSGLNGYGMELAVLKPSPHVADVDIQPLLRPAVPYPEALAGLSRCRPSPSPRAPEGC